MAGGKTLPAIPLEKRRVTAKVRLLAPISARYRTRSRMRAVPEQVHGVFEHFVMPYDRKILFMKNSKAGCTTVAALIVKYATGKDTERVHTLKDGLYQSEEHWQLFDQAFRDSATFCFSMTRHPVERFASAFLDFCVDMRNASVPRHLPAMRARGFVPGGDTGRNLEAFLGYVEESLALSGMYSDRHWREQHRNLGLGYFHYDFIGKLENYADDIRFAFESAGLGGFLAGGDWRQRRNVSSPDDVALTRRQIARIEALYARDFEMFGYE
ncbi:MAG: sulfotransferase family 2 domain-containing protein [Paracoccaceae bacterium]